MPISRIIIDHLRNIDHIELSPSPSVNILVGPNGSGKTSLLEALYLLGHFRSFKTNKHKVFIKRGAAQTTIFGEIKTLPGLSPISAGITKNVDGKHKIKIAGMDVLSRASLLELMPMQLIEPETFKLLSSGPSCRRQFIDWGVFHVEHAFFPCWKRLSRCLKQRNKLLRRGKIDHSLLSAWNTEFVLLSEELTLLRSVYVAQLKPIFNNFLSLLLDIKNLELNFYSGWNIKYSLEETLAMMIESDHKRGFTQAGPHRADLKIKHFEHGAEEVLSRGQQKLVICSLKLAQGYHFSKLTGRPCVYLLDDLASELDKNHRDKLCGMLLTLNCQLFITSLNQMTFLSNGSLADTKVFHVEHGKLVS